MRREAKDLHSLSLLFLSWGPLLDREITLERPIKPLTHKERPSAVTNPVRPPVVRSQIRSSSTPHRAPSPSSSPATYALRTAILFSSSPSPPCKPSVRRSRSEASGLLSARSLELPVSTQTSRPCAMKARKLPFSAFLQHLSYSRQRQPASCALSPVCTRGENRRFGKIPRWASRGVLGSLTAPTRPRRWGTDLTYARKVTTCNSIKSPSS